MLVNGRDIHKVRTDQRDRLAIHYHQSYQVRHFRTFMPNLLLQPAGSDYPVLHLFDEPQFNTQDGYIGFMLDFFSAGFGTRTAWCFSVFTPMNCSTSKFFRRSASSSSSSTRVR
ncbi:hypothetical protein QW131_32970 [Roseibium salinum]|nr:hypothetical protein [Roseibium salinum]